MIRKGIYIKQRDDEIGNGSYGVVFDRERNELILATRNGRLEFVDAENLQFQKFIQVAPEGTRLWSLCLDEKTGTIYAGDYDGGLYVIEKGNKITKFNVEELYRGDKRLSEGFKPAVWGLEITDIGILIGTRWGNTILLDHDFGVLENYSMSFSPEKNEDISCIRKFADNLFLVGTRYGRIFPFDLNAKLKLGPSFLHKKPSLQKENAVWTMASAKGGILACFADG